MGWNRRLNQNLKEIGLTFEEMIEMSKRQIIKKILEYDSKKWHEDLSRKTSLRIYRKNKKRIQDEKIYNNTKASELIFRARSNTLNLNIDNRHRGGSTTCDLCNIGEEDMQHFLLECGRLEDV